MNYINTVNEFEEGVYFFAEAPTMFPLPSDEKMCTSVCLFVCLFVCLWGCCKKSLKKILRKSSKKRKCI